MTQGKVTILGINGHLGNAAAAAFAAAGWEVTGFGRANRRPIPGVRFVAGDARNVEEMRAAIGDSDVVVNALNLPYDAWTEGRSEAQLAAVIEAVGGNRTLMFPGNIYNYSATDRVITPDLKQVPQTPRGAIRVRLEKMLEAASRQHQGLKVVIVRAGDFFGPHNAGDWFDQVILREAGKGKAALTGTPGIGHAWAYLPDLGRAFEVLAFQRAGFAAFETFHFAGYFATQEELGAALQAGSPVPLKLSRFPHFMLTLVGLTNPIMRDIAKMVYLWRNPMELRDARLDAILGDNFATPFDEAVASVVAQYVPSAKAAA
ncbi:MAG TPA: NAD-dependent epimerase/dehydratase family protein [Devosia sp.]|nr:NAD-dependent epimerase/dehydratase family protein [Devosia sp.]